MTKPDVLLELAVMCDEIAVSRLKAVDRNNQLDEFGTEKDRWANGIAFGLLEDVDRALRIAAALRAQAKGQDDGPTCPR